MAVPRKTSSTSKSRARRPLRAAKQSTATTCYPHSPAESGSTLAIVRQPAGSAAQLPCEEQPDSGKRNTHFGKPEQASEQRWADVGAKLHHGVAACFQAQHQPQGIEDRARIADRSPAGRERARHEQAQVGAAGKLQPQAWPIGDQVQQTPTRAFEAHAAARLDRQDQLRH